MRISAGNIGILVNGGILSTTAQACPRKILLRVNKIEAPIDRRARITFTLGRMLEEVHAIDFPDCKFNARLAKNPIIYKDIEFGAECDAIEIAKKHIWELKSVSSTSILKQVFGEKKYKFDNAIQLAAYLMAFNVPDHPVETGTLRYTNTVYDSMTINKVKCKFVAGQTMDFHAKWVDNRLYMDDVATIITKPAIKNFLMYTATFLAGEVPLVDVLKPVDEKGEHVACMWCEHKDLCDVADKTGLSSAEFVKLAKDALGVRQWDDEESLARMFLPKLLAKKGLVVVDSKKLVEVFSNKIEEWLNQAEDLKQERK